MDDERRSESDGLAEPRKQPEGHVMLAPLVQGNRLILNQAMVGESKEAKNRVPVFLSQI